MDNMATADSLPTMVPATTMAASSRNWEVIRLMDGRQHHYENVQTILRMQVDRAVKADGSVKRTSFGEMLAYLEAVNQQVTVSPHSEGKNCGWAGVALFG